MKKQPTKYRFLFAGGGTGGHLFPAVAVAEKIKELIPEADILFVGTKSKIESVVVPKLGFKFKSIWIKGFARKFDLNNVLFPLKLLVSTVQSIYINAVFKPRVAIGSGGYVSGPAIYGAWVLGAKIMLLEQNSFPGITTRMLEKKAEEIHISFSDSEKYLREKNKLFVTGNPVRNSLVTTNKAEALNKFGLDSGKKTLLILGGSLGAASLNKAAAAALKDLMNDGIQVIWQTGKNGIETYKKYSGKGVWVDAFIDDMGSAFSAADLVVSRAGATTIAEMTTLGLPVIFVPSPNVAANHQYLNAKSLSDVQAAYLLKDENIVADFYKTIKKIIFDDAFLKTLSSNIKKFSKPDAALIIAQRAIKLAEML